MSLALTLSLVIILLPGESRIHFFSHFRLLTDFSECRDLLVSSHQSKTTTRQMLNLCIPMMPFTPGPSNVIIPSPRRGMGFCSSLVCVYTIIIIPSPSRGWDLVLAWFHVHYYSSSSSSSSSCRSDPWLRLWPSTQDI